MNDLRISLVCITNDEIAAYLTGMRGKVGGLYLALCRDIH